IGMKQVGSVTHQTAGFDVRSPRRESRHRVTCRQRGEQSRLAGEEGILTKQGTRTFLSQRLEGSIELLLGTGVGDADPLVDGTSRCLHVLQLDLRLGIGWIEQHADQGGRGCHLVQELKPLRLQLYAEHSNAGYVPSGPAETCHQAELYWVGSYVEDDRDRRCRGQAVSFTPSSTMTRPDYQN